LYDALSYYYDHKDEIEDFIEANERAYDELLSEADEVNPENQAILE
jgi:prefoldin subunit 5